MSGQNMAALSDCSCALSVQVGFYRVFKQDLHLDIGFSGESLHWIIPYP